MSTIKVDTVLSLASGTPTVRLNQGETGSVDTDMATKLKEIRSAKDFGAAGDGVTDDSTEIAAANTAGAFRLTRGTYKLSVNTTISSDFTIENGADFTIDTGIILTITGAMTAPMAHVFKGAGTVQFEPGAALEVPIQWFGAIPDSTGAGVANTDAINAAIKAADVTDQFRNIPVVIPAGKFTVDASGGAGVKLPSYCVLRGTGDSSIIEVVAGAAAGFSVFEITEAGANSIIIENFNIFGQQATQSQTIHGIHFNVESGVKPIYNVIRGMLIKEMRGNGILFGGSVNVQNSKIIDGMVRDCNGHNIFIQRGDQIDITNMRVRSAKSGFSGITINGGVIQNILINGCRIENNSVHGVFVSDVAGRISLTGNYIGTNGDKGVFLDRANLSMISSCFIEQNTGAGITTDQSDDLNITANHIRSNSDGIGIFQATRAIVTANKCATNTLNGILLDNSNDCMVSTNSTSTNSTAADDTSSGIIVQNFSDNNMITNNQVRHGGGATQQKHGINISTANCDANLVINNDLLNSGRTSSFNDGGTGTVTTSANRV